MAENTDSFKILGLVHQRTKPEDTVLIAEWEKLQKLLLETLALTSGVHLISAAQGAGKTTFIHQLLSSKSSSVDMIPLAIGTPISDTRWLLPSLASWLGTKKLDPLSVQQALTQLSESSRPICILLDGADFIASEALVGDISAVLNMADSSRLNLSIICPLSEQKYKSAQQSLPLSSKILIQKELPQFSDAEMSSFLNLRISLISQQIRINPKIDISSIVNNANGIPQKALAYLGEQLGLAENKKRPQKTGGQKKSSDRLSKTYNIEDLLTPAPLGGTKRSS